ncbi:MAG: hypothetical protein RQ754_01300 [Desulfuromonadales bacterium]|nr:hypothetical protein [Desulfuromonadales bacterium]
MTDNFRQLVEFDYRYNGLSLTDNNSKTTRSSRHRFGESYRMDIDYAILGPNLLLGGIGFKTELNQTRVTISGTSDETSSSQGERYLYDVYGTFLRYAPVSARFYSNSKMNYISRDFSPNYDQTIYANGLSLHVKNKIVPFDVEFRQTKTETDGLSSDYKRNDKSLTIDARHFIGQVSQTFLDLRFDDFQTEYSNDLEDYELLASRMLLNNKLSWRSGKNVRRLSSRVTYREQTGSLELRSYDWSENLDWHFGRVLIGTLYYNRVFNEMDVNSLLRNQARASLRHQFVEAIDTQLGLELRDTTQNDGEERDGSGDISLSYRNRLSGDSHLHTNLYYRLGRVDRNFNSYLRVAISEPHLVDDSVAPIILDQQNVLTENIVVRHADPAERIIPFVRDLDYRVEEVGATTLITILPGSDIVDGTNLLISYNYQDNAEESYEYSNRRVSVTYKWHKAFRLHARYDESLREHLSGEELFTTNNGDLREGVLGLDGSWQRSTYGLEYKNRRAYYEDRQSLEAFYQQALKVGRGVLSSGVGNYYAIIDPGVSREYWSNTFSFNSKYLAPVWKRASLSLLARYANTQSRSNDRDDFSLGFDFRHGYGKFMMTLDAKVDWRFIDDRSRREETLNLKLTRYL